MKDYLLLIGAAVIIFALAIFYHLVLREPQISQAPGAPVVAGGKIHDRLAAHLDQSNRGDQAA